MSALAWVAVLWLGQVGAACETDAACGHPSLLCAPEPEAGPTCHLRCREPKPGPGQRCTVLAPPDDEALDRLVRRFVWTRDRDRRCQPCTRDAECGLPLDRCIQLVGGERVCSRDCAWDDRCPTGFVCRDPADADGRPLRRQCVPAQGCCQCDQGFSADPGGTISAVGSTGSGPGGWSPQPPPPTRIPATLPSTGHPLPTRTPVSPTVRSTPSTQRPKPSSSSAAPAPKAVPVAPLRD